jgi:polar amino acid transport system substrate-binding protein
MRPTIWGRLHIIAWCAVAIFSAGCASGGQTSSSSASAAPGAAASANNLLEDVKRRGQLVISTDPDYKPQSFRNPDGSWIGFDVDVGREVARRLGVKPVFKAVNFALVTSGGWNGQWDVNIDSMAITNQRAKVLWFSEPYYYTPASFAVYATSPMHTLADLAGKKLGVGASTTYEDYLDGKMSTARIKPPARTTVVTYDTDELALQDLAAGDGARLDGVLTALPTVEAAIKRGMPVRVISPPVFEDSSAIALDRASPLQSAPLLWAVTGIVHDMHHDGTLSKLSVKYYGIDITVRQR